MEERVRRQVGAYPKPNPNPNPNPDPNLNPHPDGPKPKPKPKPNPTQVEARATRHGAAGARREAEERIRLAEGMSQRARTLD